MPKRQTQPFPSPARAFNARSMRVVRHAAIWLAFIVLFALPALAAQPILVTALEPASGQGSQALTISLSRKPESVRTFILKEPARLVLDMSPARLAGGARSLPAGHALFHGVRAAQHDPRTVRVVFDLKHDVTHNIESRTPAAGSNEYQLIVSLFPAGQASPPADSVPAATTATDGKHPAAPEAYTAAATPSPVKAPPAANKKILLFGQAKPESAPAAAPSPWGTFDLSGSLMAKGAQELSEDEYPEQARSFRNTVRIEGKWTPPLPANETRDASATYLLASGQSDYLGFGPDPSDDDYDLELFEGYIHHATSAWELRLGRQIVRWGKTDQISPVDNLNSQDMREFFIPDLEERKVPNWMARARLFPDDAGPMGAIALEGVFVPFFEENTFDWTGNTWALLGVEDTGLRIDEEDPKGLDNSGYGLRAAATVAGWDLAVSWLQATEKSPALRLNPFHPKGPTLEAEYGRQNIYGFEFETTLDTFGFRGEAAYFDRQNFNTEDFDPAASPMSHWILGLDYIGEADWYVNVQFSHQHIFEYDEDTLFLRRDNFYVNGELNKEFWRGNLMLKLRYAVDLNDGSSFLTPEAILTYFTNLELSLGTNLFFGPKDTLFGRYRDNDQAFLQATYRF